MSSNYSHRSNRRTNSSRNRRSGPDISSFPLEQGIVCSLKESFGFIHCAQRPEQVFFHYSEVRNEHPNDLQVDVEVEFHVGPSEKDPQKLAAYAVHSVPTGTVVWETEEEEGKLYQGVVEKAFREGRGRDRDSNSGSVEGSIQVLIEEEDQKEEEDATKEDDSGNLSKKKKGPLIRFRPDDYQASSNKNNNGGGNRSNRLFPGDLVQFRILTDRRTKQRYARYISLLQTEKERTRQKREAKLLANATEEQGVVISLCKGYGFLKSNRRREHVYFHYSNMTLPKETDDTEQEFTLEKGQEMKFLVIQETVDGGKQKCSARQIECLPKGSVEFHKVVAKGVKGVVTLCPRPPSGGNRGYADDKDGSIKLLQNVDAGEDGEKPVEHVSLQFSDAPGGVYNFQQRGSSVNGLWIEEGDTLLFDVVKELADGSYYAAPTLHKLGVEGTVQEPTTEDESQACIRLLAASLISRAEGILHTLKPTGGYGFIHFAERPIDVHFNTYNLLPDELQVDLRKQLGLGEEPVKLEVGVGMQFDICAHGTVASGGRGRTVRRGKSPPRGGHERENVKAHRVLLLPASCVVTEKAVATEVKATIMSTDTKQPYAGFLDVDGVEVESAMSLEERHPLVSKMIDSFMEESAQPNGRKSLVFRDVLSIHEDRVVVRMIKDRASGVLTWKHIPVAGFESHPGRLCIRRLGEGEEPTGEEKDSIHMQSRKKQGSKNLRFDKSSLCEELKEDMPPGPGDVVTCDVVQSRRTGKLSIQNLKMVERQEREEGTDVAPIPADISGVGVVRDLVAKRNFGFISVLDDLSARRELLFFQLSDAKQSRKIKIGDEVKFGIKAQKSGKRVAINVEILAKGTIPSKESKKAARGYILMEPSKTSLSDTPLRKKSSNDSIGSKGGPGGRWSNVKDVRDNAGKGKSQHADVHEEGCILLLEDRYGIFDRRNRVKKKRRSKSIDSVDFDARSVDSFDDTLSLDTMSLDSDDELDDEDGAVLLSHVPYKNGAISIHGPGSCSAMDSTRNPRRGDLVSFLRARSGKGVRDVRVVKRQEATRLRGRLENIDLWPNGDTGEKAGQATFIASTENEDKYRVDLAELVSCVPSSLKEKEQVEGVMIDGSIFGLCRTTDLYLESKLGASHKERPKLNLSVKRKMGGTIMAQSMMAKGPDGTIGFATGWTTRTSRYAETQVEPQAQPET